MLHYRSPAAFVVALLVAAAAAWNPAAAQEHIQGILETRGHETHIDTMKWKLGTTPFPITHVTDGWGGRADLVDTFYFPELQQWPFQAWVLYSVDGGPEMEFFIEELSGQFWYVLPVNPEGLDQDPPQVMFEPRTGLAAGTVDPVLPDFEVRPNPTSGRACLTLRLDGASAVRVAVYAPDGRLVRDLFRERLGPGIHDIEWDGLDSRGAAVAPGVYLCRTKTDGGTRCRRLVVTD